MSGGCAAATHSIPLPYGPVCVSDRPATGNVNNGCLGARIVGVKCA